MNPFQKETPYTDPNALGDHRKHMGDFGIYDHFKGGVYLVTGISEWSSGNQELVVEYLSMTNAKKFTRLVDQWCEVTKWPDGKYRSRFVYRGPDLMTRPPPWKVVAKD